MTGTAPTVTLAADTPGPYPAGAHLSVTATITDADDTTETLTGVDQLGRRVRQTIVRDDVPTISWSWQSTGTAAGTGNPVDVIVPAASDVLVCTVIDAQANTVTADLPVDVVVAMLVGVDNPATASTASVFPRMAVTRIFAGPGAGIPSWTAPQVKTCVQLGIVPHLSFKDTPTPALVTPWLDAIPPGVRVWLTYHHEPEGDLPAATYVADWITLAQIVKAHPNAAQVTLVGILGYYAQTHGKGPWRTWWAGVEQVMGWDCYVTVGSVAYPPPATFFAPVLAAAQGAGVPWMVPELGSPILAGDTGGQKYAAWLTSCVTYLRGAGCRAVSVWDAKGTNGIDYSLSGAPLAAWQKAVATQ